MISMSNAIVVLFASILVFSMTPGLAFFYGGQKRRQYDDFNFFDLRNWNFTVYQLRIWAVLQRESFWNYRKFPSSLFYQALI